MYMSAGIEGCVREIVFRIVAEWAGRKAEQVSASHKLHGNLGLDEYRVSGIVVELSDIYEISFHPNEVLRKIFPEGTKGTYVYEDIDVGELCRLTVEKVATRLEEQSEPKKVSPWRRIIGVLTSTH